MWKPIHALCYYVKPQIGSAQSGSWFLPWYFLFLCLRHKEAFTYVRNNTLEWEGTLNVFKSTQM